jgi:glucokinase
MCPSESLYAQRADVRAKRTSIGYTVKQRGRPPYEDRRKPQENDMRIGIDIGGTKIVAGLVDSSGKVVARKRILVGNGKSYLIVRDAIAELVRDILSENNIHTESLERIGVASAGQVDNEFKKIIFSPNLGWRNVPLRDDIETALKVHTFVDNDVNAAIYGEWRFGAARGADNVLGIFIGTGIGGGIIINGKVYRGFSNAGGEIGHIILNPFGYPCNCGNTGCFEAYCGGGYIVERVKKHIKGGYRGKVWELIGGNIDALNTGHVENGAALGDDLCSVVWTEVLEYLGAGLASMANLLNPEIIVMGGGVVYGTRHLIEDVKPVMEKKAMAASLKNMKLVKAKLKEDAAIIGAAFIEP